MHIHEWLAEQKAKDAMTRNIVALRSTDRLSDATAVLMREQISGAPVVDESGVCVGVLSATDILSFGEKQAEQTTNRAKEFFHTPERWYPAHVYAAQLEKIQSSVQLASDAIVDRYMTRDLVTVPDDAPLSRVARYMVDAHVHRVLVTDCDGRLQGIISTTDVIAALVRAEQEAEVVQLAK